MTSPRILLDNVQCTGTEESLLDCPRSSEIGVHNCGPMDGAGVRCGGQLLNTVTQCSVGHAKMVAKPPFLHDHRIMTKLCSKLCPLIRILHYRN